MFDWVQNRLLPKGLKYWVHSYSQPTNEAKKILSQAICVTLFLKSERSWWDSKQNECSRWSSRPKGSLKRMLWEISQNSQENISFEISFLVFSFEFCRICKNTFLAEQHRTTASDYSSINSSGGSIGKKNVNYDTQTKAYLLIWVRSVKLLKGQSRWKNRFQKQSFADLKLGVLKNFLNFTGI